MPGISRVNQDSAGGTILGGGQGFVTVEGTPWAVKGDAIAGHGKAPHAAPVMAEGSPFVRINGIPVCRAGHAASCSPFPAANAPGSPDSGPTPPLLLSFMGRKVANGQSGLKLTTHLEESG